MAAVDGQRVTGTDGLLCQSVSVSEGRGGIEGEREKEG